MGNQLSAVVGYMIIFYLKLREKVVGQFYKNSEKNYYHNDLIIKDDEYQASKYNELIVLRYTVEGRN